MDARQIFTKNFHPGSEEHPPISPTTATTLSILFTTLYVLPFYLSPLTRPSPTLPRDAPSVIRARIRFVTLSCALSTLITVYVLATTVTGSAHDILRLLGWWPLSLLDVGRCLLLTGLLFAGPLFERGVVDGGWREWVGGKALGECLGSWIGFRNFVAGPISEELLFRSLLVPLSLLSTASSPTRTVFSTPLYFGLAHIHHFYEFTLTHPRVPLLPALLRSLFQFTYTTLFGWYATFLFLRTGSLLGVVLVHAGCNWLGLPRLWGKVGENVGEQVEEKESGGAETRKKVDFKVGAGKLGVEWTVAYYLVLVAGVLGFWQGFWVLTESGHGIVAF